MTRSRGDTGEGVSEAGLVEMACERASGPDAPDGDRVSPLVPFLDHDGLVLYEGDALTVLRELPAETVDMVLTSPPFFGLRDYGTGRWEGGPLARLTRVPLCSRPSLRSDVECDHRQGPYEGEKA